MYGSTGVFRKPATRKIRPPMSHPRLIVIATLTARPSVLLQEPRIHNLSVAKFSAQARKCAVKLARQASSNRGGAPAAELPVLRRPALSTRPPPSTAVRPQP